MFQMFELLSDIDNLKEKGLTQDEIDGYLDMFFEAYSEIMLDAEVV